MKKTETVPERYLPIFCQELHQLYRAGISPADGIALIREDEDDPQVARWLDELTEHMNEGLGLAQAMRASDVFPRYMTDMISLAENTGRLEETLVALERHYVRKLRMKADIRSAVTVPAVLLLVMIAVVVLLVTQVLPVFDRVFSQLGVKMGPVAAGMMNAGAALAKAGTVIAAVLVVIVIIALIIRLVPKFRASFSNWFTFNFGGRGIMGQMAVSRFASSMAMAASSGMNMEEAVEMSAGLCGGAREIDEKTALCREKIEAGESPADALSQSGLFSGRDCSLLKLAERTGSLPETLEKLASRQEEESLRHIDRVVGTVEPAIVVITSVLAGVILLSVMLPMMGLLSGVG
ncbi:MAG: type II secretion system F family protein [Clostridia bacterium]|nr:type II secretion system F family protein [Clostridia bacterium]